MNCLRHHQVVINKVAEVTLFMPQGGNSETIIDQLGNVINNFMYGHKINIPKLILKKLDDLEVNKVGRVYGLPCFFICDVSQPTHASITMHIMSIIFIQIHIFETCMTRQHYFGFYCSPITDGQSEMAR